MNGIIHLCQRALQVPVKFLTVVFLFFKSLELFDKVNLKLRTNPHSKFEGYITMSVCTTISSCSGLYANGVGFFNPFFYTDFVIIQSRLTFNYGEFAIIKIGVVN